MNARSAPFEDVHARIETFDGATVRDEGGTPRMVPSCTVFSCSADALQRSRIEAASIGTAPCIDDSNIMVLQPTCSDFGVCGVNNIQVFEAHEDPVFLPSCQVTTLCLSLWRNTHLPCAWIVYCCQVCSVGGVLIPAFSR